MNNQNQNEKEQEILNLVNTLKYFSKNNSQVFYKHGKDEAPFTLMLLDHLNNQKCEMLTKYMPEIVEAIVKIDVKVITDWLIENPVFNNWLLPQDKIILRENDTKKNIILQKIFFNCSKTYEEAKKNNGYSILLINLSESSSLSFLENLQDKPDLIKESFHNIPIKKRKQSIISLLKNIPFNTQPLKALTEFTCFVIDSGIITKEEVSTIITSKLITLDLLMPNTKIEQIISFQHKNIELDFNYIKSILGTTSSLHLATIKRDFDKSLEIMLKDPLLDFEYLRNSEDIKKNLSPLQKYEKLINTLNKEEEIREIIKKKNIAETILYQVPEKSGTFEPPAFKI